MVSKLSIITDETLTLAVTDMPVNNDLTAKQVTKMMSVFLTNFLDKQLLNRMIKIFSFFKHIQGTLGYSDYTINM